MLTATTSPKNKFDSTKIMQVYIVDDHPVVRDGLSTIINHEKDMNVCGEAESEYQAIKDIACLTPDVVIVDISLKNSNGIDLTKNIKANYPKINIIVFSVHDESVYAERALIAGAKAYLMKDAISDNIVTAIRTVSKDDIYISSAMSKKLLHRFSGNKAVISGQYIENLSDRELEVFRLIGQGFKASEIGKQLFLSVKTIETYRARIKEKLDLPNASALLQHAIKWAKMEDDS